MNKIKKYIKNPKLILLYLINLGCFNWMNDKIFLKFIYILKFNKKLDLINPETFNEKLQWLKIFDRKSEYTIMVDKYEVKKYVAKKIGSEYIIENYGVWENFEDIEFNKLPNQFVLKCTHDSGGNVICKDKTKFEKSAAKEKINKSLKNNYFYYGREWPYKNVKPRIIAEKYMQNNKEEELKDYKFYCFNGEPKFLYVSEGLSNHKTAKIDFFDMDFKEVPFSRDDYMHFHETEKVNLKPENFEKMKELARILSNNIPFLRVDFYEINKKVFFGELTFSPCSGFMKFKPEEWDKKIGDMLKLPEGQDDEK